MLGGIVPELIETEPYSGVANYSRTICRGLFIVPASQQNSNASDARPVSIP